VLTHASLMVAGPAAADAVARAKRLPDLHVGLHLVAVEGPAVLPAGQIPLLVGASGWFPSDQLALALLYAFSPAARRQLAQETEAQFASFAATGLALSHADAHKHMHLHPYLARLLIETGLRYGLRRVRVPAEPPAVMRRLGEPVGPGAYALHAWTRLLRRKARRAGMSIPDNVFGLAWSGHMTEARVLALLDVAGGTGEDTELYFHPATHQNDLLRRLMPGYRPAAELSALTSQAVREKLQDGSAGPLARRSR
jgi:hopanoid biosynthesis associated protein HpnK